jgi:hypothetical protein
MLTWRSTGVLAGFDRLLDLLAPDARIHAAGDHGLGDRTSDGGCSRGERDACKHLESKRDPGAAQDPFRQRPRTWHAPRRNGARQGWIEDAMELVLDLAFKIAHL